MWVVIDAADRPDLIEDLRRGRLRTFECDRCCRSVTTTTSLLVDSRRHNSPLLFAPDPEADEERTRVQYFASVVKHRKRANGGGRPKEEQWTIPDALVIPHELLAIAVDRDVELDLAAYEPGKWIAESVALQRYGDWLGGVVRHRQEKQMRDAITALTKNGHSAVGFSEVVRGHQVLLTAEADKLLSTMQDVAEQEGQPAYEKQIAQWRHFLRLCRRDGLDTTLASLKEK
jgi:hypothetical protein